MTPQGIHSLVSRGKTLETQMETVANNLANVDTIGYKQDQPAFKQVLARALGVETKSGSGKRVAEMWQSGRGKEIAEYCLQDCYVTYACYSKMTFREPLPSERVLAKKDLIEVT